MKIGLYELIQNGDVCICNYGSQDELFDILSNQLEKEGKVKESFHSVLKEREKLFPTGIATKPFNIAMPHVDSEHINTDALYICLMNNPILFNRMDKTEETLSVKIVFVLLIKSIDVHMDAIMSLAKIWSNIEVMKSLLQVQNKKTLLNVLNSYDLI